MDCWLTMIQDFIARNKIKLKVALACLVLASCENDCHLMDAVHKLGLYNDKQLFDINAV
jgi:hypothetical protein